MAHPEEYKHFPPRDASDFPTLSLDDLPAIGTVGITRPNDPAFARPASDDDHGALGLSKREEFAKAAMQGFVANHTFRRPKNEILEMAVDYAEGLIDELNKPRSERPELKTMPKHVWNPLAADGTFADPPEHSEDDDCEKRIVEANTGDYRDEFILHVEKGEQR